MNSIIRKLRTLFDPQRSADESTQPSNQSQDLEREELLGERLTQVGVDEEYLHETDPELFQALKSTCKQCADPEKCMRDLAAGNWEAGQASYCPNADKIDQLIVGNPDRS